MSVVVNDYFFYDVVSAANQFSVVYSFPLLAIRFPVLKPLIPQPVPGKLFWSDTVYDSETRSQIDTDQGYAALRAMFELKDFAKDSSVDLYFGPTAPAEKKSNESSIFRAKDGLLTSGFMDRSRLHLRNVEAWRF